MKKGSNMTLEQRRRVSEGHKGLKPSQENIHQRMEELKGNTWGSKRDGFLGTKERYALVQN